MVDPDTGTRQKVLGFDKSGPTCPVTSPNAVLVGRTQYTIMMIDSKAKGRHWNVTFYDYTASSMDKQMLHNYGKCNYYNFIQMKINNMVHVCRSSSLYC